MARLYRGRQDPARWMRDVRQGPMPGGSSHGTSKGVCKSRGSARFYGYRDQEKKIDGFTLQAYTSHWPAYIRVLFLSDPGPR